MPRIALLVAERPAQAGVEELAAAHRALGDDIRVMHLADMSIPGAGRNAGWQPDVAHSRASALWGLMAQARLEDAGLRIVNTVAAQRAGRDKLEAARLFEAAGVPHIRTIAAPPGMTAAELANELKTDYVVLKPRAGYGGTGVQRCRGTGAIAGALRDASVRGETLAAQPYVETGGADRRIVVIGGQIAARFRRRARDGEWRTNVALGAETSIAEPDAVVDAVALQAASVTGLEIAAVDFLGELVNEVNTNAGLQGAARTGIDLGTLMAEYVRSCHGADRGRAGV